MSYKVIELLQSSIDLSLADNEFFKGYLGSCIEYGAFYHKDNAETVIKNININLNSSFDREKSLILLLSFLPQISAEAFSNNAVSWMVHCNSLINQKKGEILDNLTLQVLTKLIKLSVKSAEVSKDTAKQIVPKFLTDCIRNKSSSQVSVELLECLQACMSEYPGPSGEYKTDIIKLLLSTVEARKEVVVAAARCMPLVARIGGGGKHGALHKTAWQKQQLALVSLLHNLLNQIYEHVDCFMDVETVVTSNDAQLGLEPVSEHSFLHKLQRLSIQFSSVAQYLQSMMMEEYPVVKSVAPNAVLYVVAHALKPTLSTLSTSREALAVVSVLPSILIAALRLMESLVLCLGRNVVPQGRLVSYLCSQVIVWTHHQDSDCPYDKDKPYSQTRLAVYCCLYSWLNVVGTACQTDTLVEKLLPALLADIYVQKPTVRLKVGSKIGKSKKKQQMEINLEDRSEKREDSVANHCLCRQALLTLSQLVRATWHNLKQETYTLITNTVMKLCTELPVPYSDASCLSALYQLLLTLCLNPHPDVAPPLALALAVFNSGLHHPIPQVKATCESAFSSLEKIIHPTAATMYFPLQQENQKARIRGRGEDSDTDEDEAKRIRLDSSNDSSSSIEVIPDSNDSSSRSIHSIIEQTAEVKLDTGAPDDLNRLDTDALGDSNRCDMDDLDDSIEIIDSSSDDSKTQESQDERSAVNESGGVEIALESVKKDKVKIKSSEVKKLDENEDKSSLAEEKYGNDKLTNINTPDDTVEIPTEIESTSIENQPINVEKEAMPPETNDPDVSLMLLDFKDEVNNDL